MNQNSRNSILRAVKLFNGVTSVLGFKADYPRVAASASVINSEIGKIGKIQPRHH